jgi:hypothetical protein
VQARASGGFSFAKLLKGESNLTPLGQLMADFVEKLSAAAVSVY